MRTRRVALVLAAAGTLAACTTAAQDPPEKDARSALPPGVAALEDEKQRDTGPPGVELSQLPADEPAVTVSALTAPDAPRVPAPLVDPGAIVDGGPGPDGIPPIDQPRFQRTGDVHWVDDTEQVLVVEVGDEARAYPVQILALHEIVNDTVGGVPIAVTYCPLCDSGLAYDRRVSDRVLSFGTSGRLYRSDLVMYDRQTESLWPQLEGRAVAGTLTGQELTMLPAAMLSWKEWQAAHPDAWVLSRDTGHAFSYGANSYYKGDSLQELPPFWDGTLDNRIPRLKQRVVGIAVGDDALALDMRVLQRKRVLETAVGGQPMTAWWFPGARSSLDDWAVGEGREVGTAAVFDPVLDGRPLSFERSGDDIVDVKTGSRWNALGEAVDGPHRGRRLARIPAVSTYWFAWISFHEDTRVVS
jgi:hypothetical protein